MARLPILALLPAGVFAALAGLFFAGMQREDPDALPSTFEGRDAPAIEATPFAGFEGFDRGALEGEGVKLVNFWASWCAPCRVEHPNLELLAGEGVAIYGVNYKDTSDKAAAFLQDLGDPYARVGADADGRIARDWGVYGVPETFVIDGDGRVLLRFAGPITERVLEAQIRPAIAEATGK
ncbi:DsbE family thiol:disulfide interchange protein [Palleronia sp. LCG004]|uniref:DsbE family thiol:disulfide interchange protein n=1 Tax=Palleronia sp. LCG004 TaxID=3079304 RepID=UPI0029428A0E|nr:DsbE family thiol:disulfide interchange protein [Palleronia sp. LCG004]WOI54848.1 DsbE family thiol:disulfide interchange protein [Palleronia sp. LCG004]